MKRNGQTIKWDGIEKIAKTGTVAKLRSWPVYDKSKIVEWHSEKAKIATVAKLRCWPVICNE